MSKPSSAGATYIQTGRAMASFTSDPRDSPKTVRYNEGPYQGCPADGKTDTGSRSAILKKSNKFVPSPSVLSMLASEPEQTRIPISRPPTYQLGPAKEKTFQHLKVHQITKAILEEELAKEDYGEERCKELTTTLTEHILAHVKRLPMDRYKVVCTLLIGQRLGQSMQTASRCAWDDSKDSYTSVTYENKTLYAVATIYGLYAE